MTTLQEFEDHVRGFAQSDLLTELELKANFAMGLAGESGEVVDLLKKVLFHGKELDELKLVSELGDVLWYLVALCQKFGLSIEEVMTSNIAKLQQRHGGTAFDRTRAESGKEA